MQSVAERHEEPTAIRTNLGAISVSLELSRSIWLITSVAPGGGGKMSKHSVSAGDTAALLTRFSELVKKAFAQTGKSFPIIVIQEAGLDGFWIHRALADRPPRSQGGYAEMAADQSPSTYPASRSCLRP